ncbi:unnamed protein product [Rotaria sp. Silwood2]|nr:unnamed protein product [Rotaria sp. Silwood2]
MDFSTSVFDMNNISNNISLVSICETRSSSIRSNHTYTGPCVLTKDYDDNYEPPYSIMNSYPTTAPEDMFPEYQSTFSDDEKDDFKKESVIEEVEDNDRPSLSALNTTSPMIDYNVCCLSSAGGINDCGPSTNGEYFILQSFVKTADYLGIACRDWPVGCVSFEYLNNISAEELLIRKCIMSEQQRPYLKLSEKYLIANRLQLKNIPVHNNMRICPQHRNTFGIGWCDRDNVCNYPGHDLQQHPRLSDCRRANIIMCSRIDQFPIGGRYEPYFTVILEFCIVYILILKCVSHPSCDTFGSAYEVEDTREHMNNILNVAGLSSVKSQTTKTSAKEGIYGVTTITLDDGEQFIIPKQILQSQCSHAIVEYLKYCEETNFNNLGRTKLFETLDNIKPSSQRAVSGLDEFVTEGIEAWKTIFNIVSNLSIPQVDRKRLKKQK